MLCNIHCKGNQCRRYIDIIEGSGYIALEENTKVDDIYWEGLIEATVHTPSFGLIPSLKIADTEMGVNTFAIWGGVKVIGVDVGVTYYWGGDVDFACGDYEAPEPILPAGLYAIPVYADGSGQVLYMSMGTNAVLATNASIAMTMDDGEAKEKELPLLRRSKNHNQHGPFES